MAHSQSNPVSRLAGHGNSSLYAASEYSASEIDPKEETWEDWENDDEFNEEAKCLFCTKVFEIPEEAFGHCKEHGFDFLAVKRALDLDFYKCIRMLNYIRKQVKENPELANTKEYKLTGKETFWEDDTLLQPVLEDDALLHAFEELEIIEEEEEKAKGNPVRKFNPESVDLSFIVPTTELEHSLLQLVKHSQDKAKAVEEQFNEYKAMIRRTFFEDQGEDERNARNMADPNVLLATATGNVPWNIL
ncbi:C2H2-type zinc finger transcription factor [Phycomyces blakesleeanus]|uniref:type I protein arginine methyltransferase n=2 Tax=Phycomyces blakesleeanus TaxID=4837 RepID=A0A167MN91_PHYB8|nr:C2H2-type zinc finger transcription factor [Phycomyces blakesleeanus NRRL 1555(-)]OAD73346.1 C2H2-type zinc finger transcription factor [Phycomyces blakesleeanus NRRL 1555(-)]|eukprot:XP_018291386.1 C2H2-type zinc finger transcription factor [Phycomyces blakesleeanus NRRL 1555(-)]